MRGGGPIFLIFKFGGGFSQNGQIVSNVCFGVFGLSFFLLEICLFLIRGGEIQFLIFDGIPCLLSFIAPSCFVGWVGEVAACLSQSMWGVLILKSFQGAERSTE